MSQDSRVQDYLFHILDAIAKIMRYTQGMSESRFLSDEMTQDAVFRNLEVMGEASKKIMSHDPDFIRMNPSIPWSVMYGMRNRLTHGYDKVDIPLVWKTVTQDLPSLGSDIKTLHAQFQSENRLDGPRG